ncbi:MAG: hypothetical protein KDE14_00030 [Rhodobacteraceae bacterium]|nr:hypothetical protein [Paracoccaceae bacterium]
MGDVLDQWVCVVTQHSMRSVYAGPDAPFRPECIKENVARVCGHVERAAKDHGAKLVVFPEFCVQGYAIGRSIADWERAGIELPGPETAEMAKVAKATGTYIAGAVFERIADFPGRYFMSGFVVAPDGATPEDQVKLVYRKLYALTHKTRPGDMYDQFVAKFGRAALFPVIKTPLGRIGCAVAADLAWPEVTRTLAMNGADFVFNPIGAVVNPGYASPSDDADQPVGNANSTVRRIRAWENTIYLATANIGPFYDRDAAGHEIPAQAVGTAKRIPAEIVNFRGQVIARADTDAETQVPAVIDMKALAEHRKSPQFNFLAQLQPQLHAPDYAAAQLCPLNGLATPHKDADEAVNFIAGVWDRISATR